MLLSPGPGISTVTTVSLRRADVGVSRLGLNRKTTENRSEDTDGQPEEKRAGLWETPWLWVHCGLALNSLRDAGTWHVGCSFKLQPRSDKRRAFRGLER